MDLPSAAPQMFQLPGPAQINQQPGLMQGIAQGLSKGAEIGANERALNIQQAQIQAQQSMYQVEMQKMQAQIHQQQVDSALNYVGKIGEQLQYLSPNSVKLAISNGVNTLAKVAPEFGLQPTTPDQIPDEAQDLMVQYGKLREAHQAGKVSDPTFQTEGQNIISQMSKYQREMLSQSTNILGTPHYEAGQGPGGEPTTFNPATGQTATPSGQPAAGPFQPTTTVMREQNTRQMGAAGANAPFVASLKDYHTAISGLERGDQIGDRTAMLAAGKFLGETPEQMKALAKSGFFGKNIEAGITKILGSGDLTPEQRADFKSVLDIHKQGLEKASAIQTSMYPGATGPNMSMAAQPITKTLKSGKTVISSDGGKTWFYSK